MDTMNPSVDNNMGINDVRATTPVSPTGDNRIDGLLSSSRFAPDPGQEGITTLTFSFATDSSVLNLPQTGDLAQELQQIGLGNYGPLPNDLVPVARDAFAQIERFTNLRFVEVTDGGDQAGTLRLGAASTTESGIGGIGIFPDSTPLAGDLFIIRGGIPSTDAGYELNVLHEIGHTLGLEHPEEAPDRGATPIPADFLGHEYSVVSQVGDASGISARIAGAQDADLWPSTFMYLDILALQTLYGVNETATAGSDTYSFDLSERHYLTIYDLGGNDTLSFTNGSADLTIDLTPGSWLDVGTTITYRGENGNVVGTDSQTVFLTPETVIEAVRAASGNDAITGNDANNFISAGDGNDTVSGGNGNDQVFAGNGDTGNDVFSGGNGDDTLGGGAGNDTVSGDAGSDIAFGGSGDDVVNGGAASDQVFGGAGNDVVSGGDGADSVFGGAGDDTLDGGAGNDTFYGGRGDGADEGVNDQISGGAGNDRVFAGGGNDSIVGGDGADELFNGAGNDTVDGGAGNDTLVGGAGDDVFTGGAGADTFSFFRNNGDDSITDFSVAEDILDLSFTTTNFTDAQSVRDAASAQNGGVLIDLGDGASVFLDGLSLDDLNSVQFAF